MSVQQVGRTAAEALHLASRHLLTFHPEGGPPLSMLDVEALLSRVAPEGEVRERAWHALRLRLYAKGADCLRPERVEFWLRNTSRATVREVLAGAAATAALLHLDELLPARLSSRERWGHVEVRHLLRAECHANVHVERLAVEELEAVLPEHPFTRRRPRLAQGLEEASHEERLAYVRRAAYRYVPPAAEVLRRASALVLERTRDGNAPLTAQRLSALLPEAGAVGRVLERAEHALTLRLAEAAGEAHLANVAALRARDAAEAAAILGAAGVTGALLDLEELFPLRFPRGEHFDLPAMRRLLSEECGADEAQVEACVRDMRDVFLSSQAPLDEDDASPEVLFEDWLTHDASEDEAQTVIHHAANRIRG